MYSRNMENVKASPLSSILKSSAMNSAKKSMAQVRFESQTSAPSHDVISILEDYIDGRNDTRYTQLLGLKKDPNVHVRRNISRTNLNRIILLTWFYFSEGCVLNARSATSQQIDQRPRPQGRAIC